MLVIEPFKQISYGSIVIGIGIGVLLSALFAVGETPDSRESRGSITRQGGFQYSNPILSCEIAHDANDFPELLPSQRHVAAFVEQRQKEKNIEISVYTRTLNSGRWFGVNEDQTYVPASLGKVLILIGYLKVAEQNPEILDRTFAYHYPVDGEAGGDTPGGQLAEGQRYSANKLLTAMIEYSSNAAMRTLADNASTEVLQAIQDIYSDLNIPFPHSLEESELDSISPKTYSLAFRILYNGTYLNKETSDQALALLTKTNFREGIIAGVPAGTVVAHKFGSGVARALNAKGETTRELHDCGIIYYPKHPYFLCIMTRGSDGETLKTTIADVSSLVYKEINQFFTSTAQAPAKHFLQFHFSL